MRVIMNPVRKFEHQELTITIECKTEFDILMGIFMAAQSSTLRPERDLADRVVNKLMELKG